MQFSDLQKKALQVRARYEQLEKKEIGRSWTNQEIMEGLVGDVGALMKIIQAKEGVRSTDKDVDAELKHEISDCLWCLMVLSAKYGIDLEKTFLASMEELEKRIIKETKDFS